MSEQELERQAKHRLQVIRHAREVTGNVAQERRRLLRELATKREKAGITQKDVAAAMKTSQSAVARMERGGIDAKLSPSNVTQPRLATNSSGESRKFELKRHSNQTIAAIIAREPSGTTNLGQLFVGVTAKRRGYRRPTRGAPLHRRGRGCRTGFPGACARLPPEERSQRFHPEQG